jgi:hypothetical protein
MKDDTFEKEKEILKTMIRKEEVILEMILNPVFRKKEAKTIPSFPAMLAAISWGWLFGIKLNHITGGDIQMQSKELLNALIENVLPD